jgi:hypothetical protein
MKTYKRWKFLRKGTKSQNGNLKWRKGKWVSVEGELDMCHWGLHACKKPYQAFTFVQGEILALVECRGEHLTDDDKECWREQRVVRAFKWTKKDSLKLAIFSAEQVLHNFEKEFPSDKRPREAIEAAKKVLFKDTKENRGASAESAAWSAAESAAWSAAELAAWSAAESAAWSAAESAAWSAARSARSAAESAAWSAAESAAWSVADSARSAMIKKITKYFDKLVKDLEEI